MTEFRKALGAFATGVTIVTTKNQSGEPVGVTASSFNSVSLDPPLVLWSLSKNSLSRTAFETSGHFGIHVLADTQDDLSNRFARSSESKFAGLAWEDGKLSSPILPDYAAIFECRTKYQYEGGDHIIFVGEVVSFEAHDRPPLLFHAGAYAERRPRPRGEMPSTVDLKTGRYTGDFLFNLISRAYNLAWLPVRNRMAQRHMDQREFSVLAMLNTHGAMSAKDIRALLAHTAQSPDDAKLEQMTRRGLIGSEVGGYHLKEAGRALLIELLAVSKAFEDEVAEQFTLGEMAEVKHLLQRLIDVAEQNVPKLDR